MEYGKNFKQAMVQKLLLPGGPSVMTLSPLCLRDIVEAMARIEEFVGSPSSMDEREGK